MEKAEIDGKETRLLTEHYQDWGTHGDFSQCAGSKKTLQINYLSTLEEFKKLDEKEKPSEFDTGYKRCQ